MLSIRTALVLLAALVCGVPVALEGQEGASEARVLDRIVDRLTVVRPGVGAVLDGGALLIDGAEVQVTPTIQAVIRQGADWIVDVRFRVRVGRDRPGAFENKAVGIGGTQEEAEMAAADDWVSSIGFALLTAYYGEPAVRTLGDYHLFAGLPGSHTTVSPDWMDGSDPLHSRLLDALEPVLLSQVPADWTPLTIFFVRRPGEVGSITCTFGPSRSEVCESALEPFRWPSQPAAFMLKQTYLARTARDQP